MSEFVPDPPRWKERLDQANLVEREAGRALRSLRTPEPLPASQLTRIAARIRAMRPRRRTFWLAVTAALLFGGVAVASAAHLNVLPAWLTRMVKPQPAGTVPGKRASLGSSRRTPVTAAQNTPVLPEAEPLLAAMPSVPDQPTRESVPLPPRKPARKPIEVASVETTPLERPTLPTSPLPPSGLPPPGSASIEPAPAAGVAPAPTHARQTQVALLAGPPPEVGTQGTAKVLREAVHALRAQHSPGAALLLLDRHATVLGKSAFAHEALLLRVEALLALGRKGEVLRILDGAVLTDVAASRSLLVTRGELRATANRCADSLGDFDMVLARARQADRQALFGRAMCRGKLGDSAGARADVERYRREFPTDPGLRELERQVGAAK